MLGHNDETRAIISDLARRYGLNEESVLAMLAAIERGHGTMAQFNIPELGGNGQWMLGGMTMVGDMFNSGLKATVDNLCGALSQALSSGSIRMPREASGSGSWWPDDLGAPSSTGGQNDSAYAVFPTKRRLAIKDSSGVGLYDTGDHLISGVGQQQGSNSALTFSSQLGSFSVSSLQRVDNARPVESSSQPTSLNSGFYNTFSSSGSGQEQRQGGTFQSQGQEQQPTPTAHDPFNPVFAPSPVDTKAPSAPASQTASPDGLQMLALIEKLGSLRDAGLLSEAEFLSKKADLLSRI